MNMTPHERIIFCLCVRNLIDFRGEKALCLGVYIHLQRNNHCSWPWAWSSSVASLHAKRVAALRGDHQHVPRLSPSPDVQTEQESSQHLPWRLQSQGHLHTNQKLLSLQSSYATCICPLYLVIKSLNQNVMAWKAVCHPYINHYRISPCLGFITSDFTPGKSLPPLSWKISDSAAPSREHSRSLKCLSIQFPKYLSSIQRLHGYIPFDHLLPLC